jgi:hypothetical protein
VDARRGERLVDIGSLDRVGAALVADLDPRHGQYVPEPGAAVTLHGPGGEVVEFGDMRFRLSEGQTLEQSQIISINENQKRSIACSLVLLDETLCLLEDYARGREIHSVLYEECNRLTDRQRKNLLAEIGRVRVLMRQMKGELELPTRVTNVGKRIWGHSAVFQDVVAEMESKTLRGYGQVAPGLAAYLDPKAKMLLDCLQTITSIVGGANENG